MPMRQPQPLPTTLGCQLWLIDLSEPPPADHWCACSQTEHELAGRFRFERDARRYRAAHAAMRQLLSEALHQAAADVQWDIGTHGKPHLTGHPGWHFNLSHSADWALLALHHGAPVGVDLEWCQPSIAAADALMAQHFTAPEREACEQAPQSERTALFYRVWSRKEACLKAVGCDLSTPLHLVEAGSEAGTCLVNVPLEGRHVQVCVQSLDLPVQAMAAVAVMHD